MPVSRLYRCVYIDAFMSNRLRAACFVRPARYGAGQFGNTLRKTSWRFSVTSDAQGLRNDSSRGEDVDG
jgi:hypothetical protein